MYIVRCLKNEIPREERLASLFLEGLIDKTLHVSLYYKKYMNLGICIKDAINLDHNCDICHDEKMGIKPSSPRTKANTIIVVPR